MSRQSEFDSILPKPVAATDAVEVWACGSNLYQQLWDDAAILEIRDPVRIFTDQTIARIVGVSATQIFNADAQEKALNMLAAHKITKLLGKASFVAGLCLNDDKTESVLSIIVEIATPHRRVSSLNNMQKIGDADMDRHGKLAVTIQEGTIGRTIVRLYETLEAFLTQSNTYASVELQPATFHFESARLFSGAAHFMLCNVGDFPVQAFGDNRYFQQGHGEGIKLVQQRDLVAHSVALFEGMQWCREYQQIHRIACGDLHTAILTDGGALYMAGSDKFGQCGSFTGSEATLVASLTNTDNEDLALDVHDVACGSNHTVILTSEGVMSTGSNHAGQLCSVSDVDVRKFEKSLWSKLPGKIVGVQAAGWITLVTIKSQ